MRARIARVAIVGVLAIATFAYGNLEKRVTVRIEGRPVSIRTYAATVGDALERAGVRIGDDDRVEPPLDAPLREGAVIDVYRAKEITLLLDGKQRRITVTGLTIDEVLDEVKIRGSLADSVHPSRSARVVAGMTIRYDRALALTVEHDGKVEQVITNAETVGTIVEELGIKLGKRDKIVPRPSSKPKQGMTIKVLRIGLRSEIKEVTLSFSTILRRDRNMEWGQRRVIQEGRSGLRRIRYVSKYVDGVRVSRRVASVTTVREPRPRIIAIGAGFPGCVCNRGTQTGEASWYRQADGLSAAHRTLPMGTVVRVVNLANGKWVNVVIRDRGPFIDGRIIDLSDEAFRRIASLSTGVVDVRIRW